MKLNENQIKSNDMIIKDLDKLIKKYNNKKIEPQSFKFVVGEDEYLSEKDLVEAYGIGVISKKTLEKGLAAYREWLETDMNEVMNHATRLLSAIRRQLEEEAHPERFIL